MVDVRWLIRHATYNPHCFMCYMKDGSVLFHYFNSTSQLPQDCAWKPVAYFRNQYENATYFDNKLYEALTIDRPWLMQTNNQTALWEAFEQAFTATFSLVTYAPIFRSYFYQSLLELYDDNVNYVEIRCILPEVYELDGETHDKDWVLNMYRDVTQQFIKYHPDFFGIRIIYAAKRNDSKEAVRAAVKDCIKLRQRHADLLVGLDLVGQEDAGNPLLYYLSELLYPSQEGIDLPYFFHAGETDWQDTSVDENIIDALLLNTSRIGHGYALTKHPQAMKIVKHKRVAIEVNPISNQVLGLVKDLRNHPAATLMAQDFPLVISNDDPAMWGASGLSYDFYEAFMGLGGADADLKTLKRLAMNSIQFSALTEEGKKKAFKVWTKKWEHFIDRYKQNDTRSCG